MLRCAPFFPLFGSSGLVQTPPPVVDHVALNQVAAFLYLRGWSDGEAGIATVAHILQNRRRNDAYPSTIEEVITEGFSALQPGPMFENQVRHFSGRDKVLYLYARSLAAELLSERGLAGPDPTSGALDTDTRGPFIPGDNESANSSVIRHFCYEGKHAYGPKQDSLPSPRESRRSEEPSNDPPFGNEAGTEQPLEWIQLTSPTPAGPPPSLISMQASQCYRGNNREGRLFRLDEATYERLAEQMRSGSSFPTAAVPARQLTGGCVGGPRRPRRGPSRQRFEHAASACGLDEDKIRELMSRDLEPEDFELLQKLDETVPNRRIAPKDEVKVPVMTAAKAECTQCTICLEHLEPETQVAQMRCSHAFHPDCLHTWLTKCKSACPLCGASVRKDRDQKSVKGASSKRRSAKHLLSL